MNARFRLPIVTLSIAAVLAGCGSVTDGLAFQAPAGWTQTPAMFGRLQMWIKPGQQKDQPEMLMLVKGSASRNADLQMVPAQYGKNLKVVSHGAATLCGSQRAEQFVADSNDREGKQSRIEMMSTIVGKDRYVAMYIRPLNLPADSSAESAIHSLCPIKH